MESKALTEGYSIIMALEDFVPVFLSSLGLYFLMTMVRRYDRQAGRLAALGWFMITSGGFNKATWKLVMAITNSTVDVRPLDDGLFFLMGPGFICMGFAIWYAQRAIVDKKRPYFRSVWVLPGVINASVVGLALFMMLSRPESRTWYFIVLGLTTVANFVTAGLVIRQGWRLGSAMIALLFAFNVAMILMLTGMARIEPQTIPLEWVQQITNTISNAAFAYASYRLARLTEAKVPAPQPVLATSAAVGA
jgi:hypothetical protein